MNDDMKNKSESVEKWPLLLFQNNQLELNNKLQVKTGCFLFLRTDDVIPGLALNSFPAFDVKTTDPSKPSLTAFVEIIIGLYAVYHDFACQFWKALLSDALCPKGMEQNRLKQHRAHINSIIELRQEIAHGSLKARFKDDKLLKCLKKQMEIANRGLPWAGNDPSWPHYMEQMGEEDWASVVKVLADSSNKLYHFLVEWAEAWDKLIQSGEESPRVLFATSDDFAKSFDNRCGKLCGAGKLSDQKLGDLREDLKNFYLNNPRATSKQLLNEMKNRLKNYSGSSGGVSAFPSTTIAGKFGLDI